MRRSTGLDRQELTNFLFSEAEKPFSGWDFGYITGTRRMVEMPLSWSYASKVLPYLRRSRALLDLGTGGGEFLSRLQPLPDVACATEGYPPNVPIARRRLQPLGVRVYQVADDRVLPFDDAQFDLVIDRHEAYSCAEVGRVLTPGGHFITQQVGDVYNDEDIRSTLGYEGPDYSHWQIHPPPAEFREHDMEILEDRQEPYYIRFYDVGAIVYYLKAVPWIVPNFTVRKHLDALIRLDDFIRQQGFFDMRMYASFIMARKAK